MPVRHHLTIRVADGDLRDRIEPMRDRWDPVMAAGVPAHVTVVYPEEVTDHDLLLARVDDAVGDLRAFPLDARGIELEEEFGGVNVSVTDRTGAIGALRARLLVPPFTSLGYPLHVTIVHPRTSALDVAAFRALRDDPLAGSFVVTAFDWTATSLSGGMKVVRRFELAPARVQVVAAVLRRDRRVLLGHRCADRASFPDVWDLPGGHVEPGEHAADALVRELREELGVEARGVTDLPARVFSDDDLGIDLSVWFLDEWDGDPVNVATDEHDAIAWSTRAEWETRPLAHPGYGQLLADAVLG